MNLHEANETRDAAISAVERLHDAGYLYHLQGVLKRVANLERQLRERVDTITNIALELARADGWSEDVSPATENSNEYWWALHHGEPIQQDELVDKFWDAAKAKYKAAV